MEQLSFWGTIMYILGMLGCFGYDGYKATSPSAELRPTPPPIEKGANTVSYGESFLKWLDVKEKHNDSYRYSRSFSSVEGQFGFKTTITVKEGKVTERSYEQYDYSDNKQKITDQWTEQDTTIGSHKEGFSARTIDDLYMDCNSKYLWVDPQKNTILFEVKNEGLLSTCGYVPNNCADDCFEGITIENLEWLDNKKE